MNAVTGRPGSLELLELRSLLNLMINHAEHVNLVRSVPTKRMRNISWQSRLVNTKKKRTEKSEPAEPESPTMMTLLRQSSSAKKRKSCAEENWKTRMPILYSMTILFRHPSQRVSTRDTSNKARWIGLAIQLTRICSNSKQDT